MAKNSTIYKAQISVSNMDDDKYSAHSLTLACHPSETTERLMMRILSFALNADENLRPAGGISESDEPDFMELDLTGSIKLWIEVGQPEEKRIMKASGRSDKVIIYTYSPRPELWITPIKNKLSRAGNISIFALCAESGDTLANIAARTMDLSVTIDCGEIWLRSEFGEAKIAIRSLL